VVNYSKEKAMVKKSKLDKLTYSVSEVIQLSGLSRAEIYRRVATGELDAIHVGARGGKIAIPAAALVRLFEGQPSDENGAK
jgi:hypothetical protein